MRANGFLFVLSLSLVAKNAIFTYIEKQQQKKPQRRAVGFDVSNIIIFFQSEKALWLGKCVWNGQKKRILEAKASLGAVNANGQITHSQMSPQPNF